MTDQPFQRRGDVSRLAVTFDAPMRNLPQVTRTLAALDTLWAVSFEVARLERTLTSESDPHAYDWPDDYWYARGFTWRETPLEALPRPESVKISLASPLVVELAGSLAWPAVAAGTFGTLRYLVKSADAVGSFLPRLFASYFNARVEAHEARERWRRVRRLPPDYLEHLAVIGQEAGQTIADAQPREPDASGPGTQWAPPWDEEQR